MKLLLERTVFSDVSTIGTLSVDGAFFCYTLEDTDRHLECGGTKEYGATAIPRGTYEVIIDWSNRFKRELPRLVDVPQFEGVRIHPGNRPEDTEGCVLVGSSYGVDYVYNSRAVFDKLFACLDAADSIELEIR